MKPEQLHEKLSQGTQGSNQILGETPELVKEADSLGKRLEVLFNQVEDLAAMPAYIDLETDEAYTGPRVGTFGPEVALADHYNDRHGLILDPPVDIYKAVSRTKIAIRAASLKIPVSRAALEGLISGEFLEEKGVLYQGITVGYQRTERYKMKDGAETSVDTDYELEMSTTLKSDNLTKGNSDEVLDLEKAIQEFLCVETTHDGVDFSILQEYMKAADNNPAWRSASQDIRMIDHTQKLHAFFEAKRRLQLSSGTELLESFDVERLESIAEELTMYAKERGQ